MLPPALFVTLARMEFPGDAITFQKSVPTFHPNNSDETARFLKLANEHRQPIFVTGFGNNIDPIGEPFVNMTAIRTDRLNDLIEINPGDLFVTVGAGYPLRELNLQLEREGLFLPHADLPYVGSVGGAVAVNLSADLNGHDWPIKKYLIKAEVVTPEGDIIKPGSVCFKSVSGYDVVKIFAPSWGLLGLIVNATFRVLPITAKHEYSALKMKAIDRLHFLSGLSPENTAVDAVYSRKIKEKFDPNGILPVV